MSKPSQLMCMAQALADEIIKREHDRICRGAINRTLALTVIALNEEFGFGAGRQIRLRKKIDEVADKYGGMIKFEDDVEWADSALLRRVEQIMGVVKE